MLLTEVWRVVAPSRIDDIAIAGFAPAFVVGYNNLRP